MRLTLELLWGQSDRNLSTEVIGGTAIGLVVGGVLGGAELRLFGSHPVKNWSKAREETGVVVWLFC